MSSPTTTRLRLFGVLTVTGLALVYALWGIEAGLVWAALTSIRWSLLIPVMAIVALVFSVRVVRYQLLLGHLRPSFQRQFVVCGISFLAINVVPFRLGEFVRPFMLLDDDVPWGRSLGAVVMERVVDLFMLLGMLSLVSFAVELPDTVRVQGVDVLVVGQRVIGAALLVLISGLVGLAVGGQRAEDLLVRVPVVGAKISKFAHTFRQGIRELAQRPATAAAVMGLAASVWGLTIVYVWLLLLAFPGMPANASIALTVTAVTVAGTVAIPTPGFFGPFEAFCKATLVLWAVDPHVAATFAILWHMLAFGFHVVTGSLLIVHQGVSLGALVRGSREQG